MLTIIITAVSLGFLSGFHCIGMCGPLALALPVHQLNTLQKTIALLLYNFGRMVTYSLFGLFFGFIGQSVFVAGYQQLFSIIIGSVVLLVLIYYLFFRNKNHTSFINKIYKPVEIFLHSLWRPSRKSNFVLMGLANGLLPCGMVYIALAVALTQPNVEKSLLFMASFGVGTIPFMFALSYFGSFIKLSLRNQIKKAMPFVFGIMGILLILRGMNLGVPFISPHFDAAVSTPAKCH